MEQRLWGMLMALWLAAGSCHAMQIFVKIPNGQTKTLEVAPTDSIEDIRSMLVDSTGMPLSEMSRLYFQSTLLLDGRTLGDYYIVKESTLQLLGPRVLSGAAATGSGMVVALINPESLTWGFTPRGDATQESAGPIPLAGHVKSPPEAPPGALFFPHGLLDFAVRGFPRGSGIDLSITYPTNLPSDAVYWKYGPTPEGHDCSGAACATPHWYRMPSQYVRIDGATLTLSLSDGGIGDDDLGANGIIVDQGGPAFHNAAPTAAGVGVTGMSRVGEGLVGQYGYQDHDNDAEGASRYAWYAGAAPDGHDKVAIQNAAGLNYVARNDDLGKYLFFCVTPVAAFGLSPGLETCSVATAAVIAGPVNPACGAAAGVASAFPPRAELCAAGTASAIAAGSPWLWTCASEGSQAACAAPNAPVAGGGTGRAVAQGDAWSVAIEASRGFIAAPDAGPPGAVLHRGLLDFKLVGGAPGSRATLVVTYAEPLPADAVYWKYGPTQDTPTAHWYLFPDARISEDRRSVTLDIVDGALGDDDGRANGEILDAGGPGTRGAHAALPVPSLSGWGLVLLAGLLGAAARARRRLAM